MTAERLDLPPLPPKWSAQLTKALTKRTTWRKRAGVRKLSAAPDRPES